MEVTVQIEGNGDTDALRMLWDWLIVEPDLQGYLNLAQAPPRDGQMGAVTESLSVILGQGGAVAAGFTAFSTVLIAWIRRQTGSVTVKVTRSDGSGFEYTASNTDRMSESEVTALTATLTGMLAPAQLEQPNRDEQ
ncbi:hypothetical protein GCM10027167_50350 [Nocardia heshunensis]